MDKKTLIIALLILISGFFIYRTFVNRSELKSVQSLSKSLVDEFNAKLNDKEAKIVKDSIRHYNKIDSLYIYIETLNKSISNDRIIFKKELDRLKRIHAVSDYSAYNDSLLNFIRTNSGH